MKESLPKLKLGWAGFSPMPPCSSDPEHAESPHRAFLLLASHFATLTPADDITAAYANLRERLWAIVTMSLDPYPYFLSWNIMSKYGGSDLAEYEATGSINALNRLKYKVQAAVENLP